MKSYLVIRSFASPVHGTHSEGDVIQLTEEAAKGLGGLVMPVQREEFPVVETADLPVDEVEKAVKRPRKKKE